MSGEQPRDDWITGWVDAIEWLSEYKGEVGTAGGRGHYEHSTTA